VSALPQLTSPNQPKCYPKASSIDQQQKMPFINKTTTTVFSPPFSPFSKKQHTFSQLQNTMAPYNNTNNPNNISTTLPTHFIFLFLNHNHKTNPLKFSKLKPNK